MMARWRDMQSGREEWRREMLQSEKTRSAFRVSRLKETSRGTYSPPAFSAS